MRILRIKVSARELRNFGYYEHKAYEVEAHADVEADENALEVMDKLKKQLNFNIDRWFLDDKKKAEERHEKDKDMYEKVIQDRRFPRAVPATFIGTGTPQTTSTNTQWVSTTTANSTGGNVTITP